MRRRDVLVQTFVVLFAVTLVESSRIGGWFSRFLLYIVAPIGAAFVHLLLSPRRELHSDALAAGATGGAHDLADALMRLDRASELVGVRSVSCDRTALPGRPVRERGDRTECFKTTRRSSSAFVGCANWARDETGAEPRLQPDSKASTAAAKRTP